MSRLVRSSTMPAPCAQTPIGTYRRALALSRRLAVAQLHHRSCHGVFSKDQGEADDKIIAILVGDLFWDTAEELGELPPRLVERLTHSFRTYKLLAGVENNVRIDAPYGREHAHEVIKASIADDDDMYGGD